MDTVDTAHSGASKAPGRTLAGILAGRLHDDLRTIARRHLVRERACDLDPASLVNEVYLRLVRQRSLDGVTDAQFLALASVCMGRVLIDSARRRCALKRPQAFVDLAAVDLQGGPCIEGTLSVREALTRLSAVRARQASIVRMRFLEDMSVGDIAVRTGLSPATVKREMKSGLDTLRALLRG